MAYNADKACKYCDEKSAEVMQLKRRIIELEQLIERRNAAVRYSSKRTDMAGAANIRPAAEFRAALKSIAPAQNKAPPSVAQNQPVDPERSARSFLFEHGMAIVQLYEHAQQATNRMLK